MHFHTCIIYGPDVACSKIWASITICFVARGGGEKVEVPVGQEIYEPYWEQDLFTLQFHIQLYMYEFVHRFRSLEVIEATRFQYFIAHIKQSYIRTSKRRASRMDEKCIL